jgi:hypothetical protein
MGTKAATMVPAPVNLLDSLRSVLYYIQVRIGKELDL